MINITRKVSKYYYLKKAYNRCRVLDLAETFRNLAANHATFHEETANAWRNATSIDMGE